MVAGTRTLLDCRVMFNVLRMLQDELEQIAEPDLTVFHRYRSIITLVYGQNDGWLVCWCIRIFNVLNEKNLPI